ncbi:MAG TPA: transposase, partial [Micromonospora sp.]
LSTPAPTSAPPAPTSAPPANRPVSAPPPPPPGMTPMPAGKRGGMAPADAGEPFRPTLTTAAINSARAERQRPTVIPPRPRTKGEPGAAGGFSATDYSVPVPAPRPEPEAEQAPPGSRANWPLVKPADDRDEAMVNGRPAGEEEPTAQGEGRVTPPWLADDLPKEPPVLRLVEPPPLADRVLEGHSPQADAGQPDGPPLRLVDPGTAEQPVVDPAAASRRKSVSAPPVGDEPDGDLLIFAAARSAWFTGHGEESEGDLEWSTTADSGWQAAEQAARPAVGAETAAGLPRRVPQANLVPGSPLRDERPLRIVRDAASLAENTTGYFRGWRRGQEIGGFAVGGRPGREAAGGWDFTRDTGEREDERDYEYRSAGYRS